MLPQGEDELAQHRKAINTPVQGPASDLALLAYNDICSEIGARGLSDVAIPFGFFHDAVLLEVRDDAVEEVEAIVRQSMEHPPLHLLGWEFPVPLVADVKVGQTWVG
jgi:DNA polymerase I-like protein with 3'-5' exonuclease and polymerase domains